MPDFSTMKRPKITDIEILKASLRDLGINTKTEADVRWSNGQRVRADLVAVLEGKCDLGWSRNSDGSFDLIADLWGLDKKYNVTELIHSIDQKYALRYSHTIGEAMKGSCLWGCCIWSGQLKSADSSLPLLRFRMGEHSSMMWNENDIGAIAPWP